MYQNLYENELVKNCRVCKKVLLNSNFDKNRKIKDGLQSQSNFCVNDFKENYYIRNRDTELERCKKKQFSKSWKLNEYSKNQLKTDLNFELASYMRNRLYQTHKPQNVGKTKETFDLLKCSHSFFKRWIIHQLYRDLSIDNCGSV